MKNIAVFFGGISVEREVSVITGVLTANSLRKSGEFDVFPVYVTESGKWFTGDYLFDPDNYKNFDEKKATPVSLLAGRNILYGIRKGKLKEKCALSAVINCMHGERGEDGSLAGLLNMCGIPLVSPPMLPSAVSMDKAFTKIVLKDLKVKTLPYVEVKSPLDLEGNKLGFSFPVIVKPACSGSSIGIRLAKNMQELSGAVTYALKFGERAIIEPCLKGFTEINCAAYSVDGEIFVSECERPFGASEILSFADKYKGGGREFPANIELEHSERIKKITQKVYRELGFFGIIRIDYFIVGDNIYLNEINSVPGSLAYYLFCKTTKQFGEILTKLIADAISKFSALDTVQKTFNSGILTSVGAKSSKRL